MANSTMTASVLDATKQTELDKWLTDNVATDAAKDYTDKVGLYDHMIGGAKWQDTLLNGTSSKKLVDASGATIWDPSSAEYSSAWGDATGETAGSTDLGMGAGMSPGATTTYNQYDLHPEFNTGDPLYDGTETVHASDGTVSTPSLLRRAYASGTAEGKIADEYRATLGGGM